MKVVGIVALDWANTGWYTFQALRRYGMDAHLINMFPRKDFSPKYDIRGWHYTDISRNLIDEADVYLVFESGGTTSFLHKWELKKKPKVLVINSSSVYGDPSRVLDVRKDFDQLVGLNLNYPIYHLDNARMGFLPTDERMFSIREDYSLQNEKLIAGVAPFRKLHLKTKGIGIIGNQIGNFKIIMNYKHEEALKEIAKCDIFTHGIFYAYGYTLIEAAMMGIPCFGSILDEGKKHALLDGEYPVYEIGRKGEKIPEMLEFFSSQENREICGKKMRRWAMKYHSQKACYETYKKLLEELV